MWGRKRFEGAVHRHLPGSWDASPRPPGHNRRVEVKCRLWAKNGPCTPVVMWPRKPGPGPSWETIVAVWGWVTIRGVGGHALTAPRGVAVDMDGRVALHLTAEPPTTHVVVVALQRGAERPQPWWDPIAGVLWGDLPTLPATIWPGEAGRQLPGALPWLRDCVDASPPPAEMRSALEGPYRGCGEHGPRHHFRVATDRPRGSAVRHHGGTGGGRGAVPGPPRHDPPEGGVGGRTIPANSGRPPSSLSMLCRAAWSSCTLTARWSRVCGTGQSTSCSPMCS